MNEIIMSFVVLFGVSFSVFPFHTVATYGSSNLAGGSALHGPKWHYCRHRSRPEAWHAIPQDR